MEKEQFIKLINKEIVEGESLLNDFESLKELDSDIGDGMASYNIPFWKKYDPKDTRKITNSLCLWERRVYEILKSFLGDGQNSKIHEFKKSNPDKWFDIKKFAVDSLNKNITTLHSYLETIDYINPIGENNAIVSGETSDKRPYKVFISHAGEDVIFVNELVKLLEFLGVDNKDKLLCSSIIGYQIPTSKDFADYILTQFHDYKLFVIIIHSHDYYASSYCLNEMGAAWVLKTDFFSFLTKNFSFDDMDGVINKNRISVKVDEVDAKARLNELKDKLQPIFKPDGINEIRWESIRDDFLKKVNTIQYTPKNEREHEVFSKCYMPKFERIFSLINMPDYPKWTYYFSISGNTIIGIEMFNNLKELESILSRFYYRPEFEQFNSLLNNLSELISDYISICNKHLVKNGDNYSIECFYKSIFCNPNYDVLLNQYCEYKYLISDMTLEMTRLFNLILEKIREKVPDFHVADGILTIDSIGRKYVQYNQNEKTDTPYPGFKEFLKVRSTRNKFFSKSESLDFLDI